MVLHFSTDMQTLKYNFEYLPNFHQYLSIIGIFIPLPPPTSSPLLQLLRNSGDGETGGIDIV